MVVQWGLFIGDNKTITFLNISNSNILNMRLIFILNFVLLNSFTWAGSVLGKDCSEQVQQAQITGNVWFTSPELNVLFQPQPFTFKSNAQVSHNSVIIIDPSQTYQTIDGFGNCLTGGSATLLHHMDPIKRHAILRELFAEDGNYRYKLFAH
jgi:hypothetical protein